MSKLDYRKELKTFYNSSSKEAAIVDVPLMSFIIVNGSGDPNTSQQYKDAIEALYAVSYALKFMVKKGKQAIDYAVMPLDGLWWANNMDDFRLGNKNNWFWTSMIMQPPLITDSLYKDALAQVQKKKNLPALPKLRFETFQESLSAQIMHLGPFAAEAATIEKLHNYIKENGYAPEGKHHEIYLSDFRKTAPEKLKTLIRQPIKKQ